MTSNPIAKRDPAGALTAEDPRAAPCYPAAEVGRLVGLHPARVRRWLKGYCAENEHVDEVRKWWGLTEAEVRAAVEFERGLAA